MEENWSGMFLREVQSRLDAEIIIPEQDETWPRNKAELRARFSRNARSAACAGTRALINNQRF